MYSCHVECKPWIQFWISLTSITSVADPEHFDADPDPTFQADADPVPAPDPDEDGVREEG